MDQFLSRDHKVIYLPVPLGTTVYQYNTTCNDACTFQREKFYQIVDRADSCRRDLPCHTKLHSIESFELTLSNVSSVLEGWKKTIFETEAEASVAGEKITAQHKKQLLDAGLEVGIPKDWKENRK